VLVALSVAVAALLAAWGLIGESHVDEKIEQLQVVISPAGETGLRITETIDQDFGTTDRHGPQLVVPSDLGTITEVAASSDDAPDDLNVAPAPYDSPVQGTRIRVGDPNVTVRGQHRYTISYVLPAARYAGPVLFLDAVGADSDIPIEQVTVVLDGVGLDRPTCSAGGVGAEGGCTFEPGAPLRTSVARLEPRQGITIGGEITEWGEPQGVEPPPLPERRPDRRGATAALVAVLGIVAAGATYRWSVRAGANEVLGASAAEAAHGVDSGEGGSGPTRKVSDAELAELATIEFAPPRGLEPWQGRLVLTEVLDDSVVTAWFSGAIADGLIDVEQRGDHPRLSRGTPRGEVDPLDVRLVDELFADREVIDLDGYDAAFAETWSEIEERQAEWVRHSGWWWARMPAPGRFKPGGCATFGVLAVGGVVLVVLSGFLLGLLGVLGGMATAVLVGLGLPALVARVAYAPLRPGRTAAGSAWALRTESFRRFLVDSEAQYVEWAWKQGLLRQYSAWAVALDAADAWQSAMERTGVPREEIDAMTPLVAHQMRSSFVSTHTPPSTSSSGGSSGFSGGGFSGSVGGGGGGGSHGSW
jgi:uncharacterized membrane protein YgcG